MFGNFQGKGGTGPGLAPYRQAAAAFFQEVQAHLQAQVGAVHFPPFRRGQEMFLEFCHLKAGTVVGNGHLDPASFLLDLHSDPVAIIHGIA